VRNKKRLLVILTYHGLLRLALASAFLFFIFVVFTQQLLSSESWSSWRLPLSGRIIAIDPGHGGPDGGAVSKNGIVEKDINLKISLYLRDYLQEAGAIVVMTREDDRDLAPPGSKRRKTADLHKRAELINESGADYFISIHMNAMVSGRWRGAQTFYDKNGGEQSRTLAYLIQDELIRNLGNTNRVAKTVPNIFLLKQAKMPAALVEAGFLSNPEEAELLADEQYQKKVAAAIYRGILRAASGEKIPERL
jgi:N-acetylmuramoyl-L-alanine amidase